MRVIYFGSGPFGLPVLERLYQTSARHPVIRVVTRPDRPQGRGRRLAPTAVRMRAAELGLPCDAPLSANDAEYLKALQALQVDLLLVADYGEILGKPLRVLPRIGVFNLHASLLPRYRGAAPVPHALLAGEKVTGVTLFRVERGLDTGPLVDAETLAIEPLETAGELEARLARLAADLLERNLEVFAAGTFREVPQDDKLATAAPKLEKGDGLIDWDAAPEALVNFVRALNPWPGAYSFLLSTARRPERTLFLRSVPAPARTGEPLAPGTVDEVRTTGFSVHCRGGSVEVLELQREGKAPLDAAAYLRGRPLRPGDRFGAVQEG